MTAEIVAFVEKRLAEIEETRPASFGDHDAWRAYHNHGRTLLAELERDHGARIRPPDGYWMKLAGISCSCTAGELALVRAWAGKARRAQA